MLIRITKYLFGLFMCFLILGYHVLFVFYYKEVDWFITAISSIFFGIGLLAIVSALQDVKILDYFDPPKIKDPPIKKTK